MPHLSAIRSAPSNCEVISYCAKYGFGIGVPRPSFFDEFEPIGIRLMSSTPHAIATSTTPEPTSEVARLVACWLEPHCVSTVVAAVSSGSPAESQAVRVMLKLCSPTWLTQPPTTWPISAGSMPVRSINADCTVARTVAGWSDESPPPRRPIGVRTASTMTTSRPEGGAMLGSYGVLGPVPKSDRSCRR